MYYYPNLRAEMARKNCSMSQLAKVLNVTPSTVSQKLGGHSIITVDEAILIKKALNVSIPIDDLFVKEAI